jgi:hypothetical protein
MGSYFAIGISEVGEKGQRQSPLDDLDLLVARE